MERNLTPRQPRTSRYRLASLLVLLAVLVRLALPALHSDACHRRGGEGAAFACCHGHGGHGHAACDALHPAPRAEPASCSHGLRFDVDGTGAAFGCGCLACEIELAAPGWPLAAVVELPTAIVIWHGLEPPVVAPRARISRGAVGARAPPDGNAVVEA